MAYQKRLFCFSHLSDYLFKLLLIGDSGVGKSCLLLRFAVTILSPPPLYPLDQELVQEHAIHHHLSRMTRILKATLVRLELIL
jgi:predicted ATP-dependent serine protease